jgi:2-C-methyl-D-erythritol 4-phosphate cytidylyltransferase
MKLPLNYAIIVAGGSGIRMGGDLPKQFLELNGLPILMHTLNVFQKSNLFSAIVLVMHPDYHNYWQNLCITHHFRVSHTLVEGGETRYHSVKNGLNALKGKSGLVAIHDGVRPLVTQTLIGKCIDAAQKHGNAIPAINPHESIRQGTFAHNHSVDRKDFWLVQTPQVFNLNGLTNHYQTKWTEVFTDDASVAEMGGEKIYIIEGERENIKITAPADFRIAETFLSLRNKHRLLNL